MCNISQFLLEKPNQPEFLHWKENWRDTEKLWKWFMKLKKSTLRKYYKIIKDMGSLTCNQLANLPSYWGRRKSQGVHIKWPWVAHRWTWSLAILRVVGERFVPLATVIYGHKLSAYKKQKCNGKGEELRNELELENKLVTLSISNEIDVKKYTIVPL